MQTNYAQRVWMHTRRYLLTIDMTSLSKKVHLQKCNMYTQKATFTHKRAAVAKPVQPTTQHPKRRSLVRQMPCSRAGIRTHRYRHTILPTVSLATHPQFFYPYKMRICGIVSKHRLSAFHPPLSIQHTSSGFASVQSEECWMISSSLISSCHYSERAV